MDVHFIDTTFRDGNQSLWASTIRTGMIEAVAEDVDRAGFDVVEVPMIGIYFKKIIRDLKENPWDMARVIAKCMPNSVKSCMAAGGFTPFEPPAPRSIIEFFYERIADIGALNRVQMTTNTFGQIEKVLPWMVPVYKRLGFKVALAISYTISPRHTDEYYAAKTKEILQFEPDWIYLKDQGGLLTIDRLRTLLPVMVEAAGDVPMELHGHCTTGLADQVYMEALTLGVNRLHTGIPPLAQGSAQPSVFAVTRNASLLGHTPQIDLDVLKPVSEKLTAIAKQDGLPIGAPLEYDYAQYVHQVPGGVISNLVFQLDEMGILGRLDEVFEESVQVRKEMGYPIMITPHSQFVVTQSAINVATGERYKVVIDELILFALGAYGEDSGFTWMDQNLKDRLLSMPRAKELQKLSHADHLDMSLDKIRQKVGGTKLSDEDFLLRYIMKGEQEIKAMQDAGAPKSYLTSDMPLQALLRELGDRKNVRYLQVKRGSDSVTLQNRSGG